MSSPKITLKTGSSLDITLKIPDGQRMFLKCLGVGVGVGVAVGVSVGRGRGRGRGRVKQRSKRGWRFLFFLLVSML